MSFGLLQGKVVAITGCSTGIGRAIAIGAAKNGANVVLHHLGDSTARDIAQVQEECEQAGAKTVVVPGDIAEAKTASEIVAAAVSSFSRIDVLVSNAGICPFHSFLDLPHPLWKRVQDVNLNGSFYVVQAVANQMAKQEPKGGSIVAVSSISALMGGGEQCHYTPTKAGIKSLMESCAIALGPMGIRCNSVLPGTIETNINKEDLSNPEKRTDQIRRVPLGRLGRPEDLVGPTLFFASDLSNYCTGASVLVDGGMAISLQ
ncbi:glucose 1-dehydrogenase [Cryptococcus neoformans var. grubii Br795]|nr:glucose 1-dehydrogenase [Cryptococcus neoformans var. grubii 125.91]OXG53028.1 glucose 1-dehydrogenase [Cryptococcus neoformans var. grubii Th84]OXG85650.1 glucose 1-dehydrogenase [Cryptococcus neoformans var. grubii MW-RSA36]OXG87157.1 glucose 1-dehydrogenase [Cryptococcus neoformans var. grubii Br795]OXH15912.1 glucose 1-dehydrogenase [Cryptococcus neoformans var. grubii]OXL10563.1 glucose 1-dehydrogenase [Cryptococcus neoformans var. grubii Gb118]